MPMALIEWIIALAVVMCGGIWAQQNHLNTETSQNARDYIV